MKFFQYLVRAQPDEFFSTGARPELLAPGAPRDARGFTLEKKPSTTVKARDKGVRGQIYRAGLAALGPSVSGSIDRITVNKNLPTIRHRDQNASGSFVTSFGPFRGGELIVEGDRVIGGPSQAGRWQYLHGSSFHKNRPHTGTRWAAVAYVKHERPTPCDQVTSTGCPVEDAVRVTIDSSGRASVRPLRTQDDFSLSFSPPVEKGSTLYEAFGLTVSVIDGPDGQPIVVPRVERAGEV